MDVSVPKYLISARMRMERGRGFGRGMGRGMRGMGEYTIDVLEICTQSGVRLSLSYGSSCRI